MTGKRIAFIAAMVLALGSTDVFATAVTQSFTFDFGNTVLPPGPDATLVPLIGLPLAGQTLVFDFYLSTANFLPDPN